MSKRDLLYFYIDLIGFIFLMWLVFIVLWICKVYIDYVISNWW
jgi:hypothetical protein